ncbi:hypothetical protein AVEN_144833-1 [Araneus ventricosus]|uniref:Uncharacterized protein n=1 Tax=Araneus ventricosus TaxID=182803 RepID=A0A4Y2X6M5_ARAVE|nr:hypothetical protein AVEN_144833-1 [Araneus ventricosus]
MADTVAENGEEPPRVTVDLRGNFIPLRDRLARCERVNMLGEASRIQYKMHLFFCDRVPPCNCLIFCDNCLFGKYAVSRFCEAWFEKRGSFQSRILTIRVCAALGFNE